MPPSQPKPPTRREPDAPDPATRHRKRVMLALGRWCRSLSDLAAMLVYRYRSDEAGATLRAHLGMIDDVRSPGQACDVLGQIIEERIAGTIKPPQLETLVDEVMQLLMAAASSTDATVWPALLLRAAQLQQRMFDPYDAAANDITRLPTGTYLIVVGPAPDVQVPGPAASHSNTVVSPATPATSKRVTRRPSAKVSIASGAASTMA